MKKSLHLGQCLEEQEFQNFKGREWEAPEQSQSDRWERENL